MSSGQIISWARSQLDRPSAGVPLTRHEDMCMVDDNAIPCRMR